METKRTGDNSVAQILAAITKYRYPVLIPWGDTQPYDLVVDDQGEFLTIQCKTGWEDGDVIRYKTASVSTKDGKWVYKKYDRKQIDYFMVYCNDKVYCVPSSDAPGTDGILRLNPAKRQIVGTRLAGNYEFFGKFGTNSNIQYLVAKTRIQLDPGFSGFLEDGINPMEGCEPICLEAGSKLGYLQLHYHHSKEHHGDKGFLQVIPADISLRISKTNKSVHYSGLIDNDSFELITG